MGTKERNEWRKTRGQEMRDLQPRPDWLEVGCGEYPVFTRPRDGGKPTLHWFETEAEACEYYRQYLRDELEVDSTPGAR